MNKLFDFICVIQIFFVTLQYSYYVSSLIKYLSIMISSDYRLLARVSHSSLSFTLYLFRHRVLVGKYVTESLNPFLFEQLRHADSSEWFGLIRWASFVKPISIN